MATAPRKTTTARPRKTTTKSAADTEGLHKVVNKQPVAPETRTIPYLGRDFEVKLPSGMQLMGWQHVVQRLQKLEDMDGEKALDLLGKSKKILRTILVHEADLDWLMDQALDGAVGDEELLGLVPAAVEAFQDAPANRAARRAGTARARLKK